MSNSNPESSNDNIQSEFKKGINSLPLPKQIGTILEQYPDDGQILKELIQNAEDAQATIIKFLVDNNSYNEESLIRSGLEEYQGPSLLVYNDNTFKDEDWQGIRSIYESVKRFDPLKVGRFGLGFKSVFHMTDLPSIISGNRIAFLDPHEVYFNEAGKKGNKTSAYMLDIQKDCYELAASPSQWLPYKHAIFNTDRFGFESKRPYESTLFRFPFRSKSEDSEISQTVYNETKVQQLFKGIKNEGFLYLIFLKFLQSIEIYKSESDGTVKLDFRVHVSPNCLETLSQERKAFFNKIVNHEDCCVSYQIDIEVENHSPLDDTKHNRTFLVTQIYGSHGCEQLRDLSTKLNVLPIVGLAFPLDGDGESIESQIFCFLPFPIEEKNATGLSMHVNGYFLTDSNRQHLKTATVGQTGADNESAEWNRLLKEILLPKALIQMIEFVTAEGHYIDDKIYYSMLPDASTLKSTWVEFMRGFYSEMKDLKCFPIRSSSETVFKSLREVIIRPSEWTEDLAAIVKKIFLLDDQNYAELPSHLIQSLEKYADQPITYANERDVSSSLLRIQTKFPLSHEERQILLEYFLCQGDYSILIGLQLLPLADGSWIEFCPCTDSSPHIYVEDPPIHTKDLLYGNVDHLFVSECEQMKFHPMFDNGSNRGGNQLCLFDSTHFHQEFAQIFGEPRGEDQCIDVKYLERVWDYLRDHFSGGLDDFRGLFILPVEDNRVEKLPLVDECVLVVCEDWGALSSGEEKVMHSLRIPVYRHFNQHVLNHPRKSDFFYFATTAGKADAVIRQSHLLGREEVRGIVEAMSAELKQELRHLFSSLPIDDYSMEHSEFLKSMPIFETLEKTFVTIEECTKKGPADNYVLPIPELIVNEDAPHTKIMLQIIFMGHFSSVSKEDIFLLILNHSIENYSQSHIEEFILKCLPLAKGNCNLKDKISATRFVATVGRGLVKPCDLLNPRDTVIDILFRGEDCFPVGVFSQTEELLSSLEYVGLRSQENLNHEEILSAARSIHESHKIADTRSKATTLLEFISKYYDNLWPHLSSQLADYDWIPVLQKRPDTYPQCLPWKGSDFITMNLDSFRSYDSALLCGSTAFLPVRPSIIVFQKPPMDEVLLHLKHCLAANYSASEKPHFMKTIVDIYNYLQEEFTPTDVLAGLKKHEIEEWIWVGDNFGRKFAAPNNCSFGRAFTNFEPYLMPIPSELEDVKIFLCACGVQEEFSYCDLLKRIQSFYDDDTADLTCQERDCGYSLAILNHLSQLEEIVSLENLFVPIECGDRLQLKVASQCVYFDSNNCHGICTEDLEETLYIIDKRIGSVTAEKLGIPSLLSVLMSDEDFGYDTGFGQSEPLTTRLRNILQNYKDGLAIMKELIQNADDAGAEIVRIVYDSRQFKDKKITLFDDSMKSLQGPALLAYNNAVFTEKDFQSIIKLGGETKKSALDKVGRFGEGFNAVYHLTDVPSFISANNVVFFDPQKKYLGKAMRNKDQPGIKLDMTKRFFKKQKELFLDQFHPFNNIFDCDLSPNSTMSHYPATLFRFPLRTAAQAEENEISDKVYNNVEIMKLFKKFYENCQQTMLFLQNVAKIEVYFFANDNETMNLVFSIDKELLRRIDDFDGRIENHFNILKTVKHLHHDTTDGTSDGTHITHKSNQLTFSIRVIRHIDPEYSLLFEADDSVNSEMKCFLVSYRYGLNDRNLLDDQFKSFLPVGAVAFVITEQEIPIKIDGRFFCFLPLAIENGLSFHINGYFAVSRSRTEICDYTCDDKEDDNILGKWNELVMTGPVVQGLIRCLDVLKDQFLVTQSEKDWYNLLPVMKGEKFSSKNHILTLMKEFYSTVISKESMELFPGVLGEWTSYSHCVFLDPQFDPLPIRHLANQILAEIMRIEDPWKVVVDIPSSICDSLRQIDKGENFANHFYDRNRFFKEIVIPYVDQISEREYSSLMLNTLYSLNSTDNIVFHLLEENPCILVSGKARKFVKPNELIDLKSRLKYLYKLSEQRFPNWGPKLICDILKCDKLKSSADIVYSHLRDLGMQGDNLPWRDIIERAGTLEEFSRRLGEKRSQTLIELIAEKIKSKDFPSEEQKSSLKAVPFLPILESRRITLLRSDQDDRKLAWCSVNEGYLDTDADLVSCSAPVIDSLPMQKTDKNSWNTFVHYFELDIKEIPRSIIDHQLSKVISFAQKSSSLTSEETGDIKNVLYSILKHFENILKKKNEILNLREVPIVYLEVTNRFVSPVNCAQDAECIPPYLYGLPHSFRSEFPCLIRHLNIPIKFFQSDYITVLKTIHNNYPDLNEQEEVLQIVLTVVGHICKFGKIISDDVRATLYLPDDQNIMRNICELCFNNTPWIQAQNMIYKYVNRKLSYEDAVEILGVKEIRSKLLDDHQLGLAFGQNEKLCSRIRRILSGYHCDETILKEMIQNADDAGASALYFIIDSRTHPSERVFTDSWKCLQGPALLIYQDVPFTENDIKAIQELGEGSKQHDLLKTGRYGVGFNSVYHLTDVPTFITKVPDKGESLYAFDPQCKYVHGACKACPGQEFPTESLETNFPDVFECYRSVQLQLASRRGTLFRLPLRNSEMLIDNHLVEPHSEAVTVTSIRNLFQTISKDLEKYLVFMKNLSVIKLCEMSEVNGEIKDLMWCASVISDEHVESTRMFKNHVETAANSLKFYRDLSTIAEKENVSQRSILKQTFVNNLPQGEIKQQWLTVDRFGPTNPSQSNELKRIKDIEATYLPLGGVAVLLSECESNSQNRFYCLLPLPIESPFPVDINGYFALEYETRRKFDDEPNFGVIWNRFLMKNVIAPAYVTLIDNLKRFVSLHPTVNIINWYYNKFPDYTQTYNSYGHLIDGFYGSMKQRNGYYFPVVTNKESEPKMIWYRVDKGSNIDGSGSDRQPNYFLPCDSQMSEDLLKLLESMSFVLIDCKASIQNCLSKNQLPMKLISPDAVRVQFAIQINSRLLTLTDKPLVETVFKTEDLFQIFVQYVVRGSQTLEGLPLILSSDGIIRVLSVCNPLFTNYFSELLPNHAHIFVHKKFLHRFSPSHIRKLEIHDLDRHLANVLPAHEFRDKIVPLERLFDSVTRQWFSKLWDFLYDSVKKAKRCSLYALNSWSLLPVLQGGTELLLPIRNLNTVVNLSSFERTNPRLVSALAKLSVYQPNLQIVSHLSTFIEDVVQNPSIIVSALKKVADKFNDAQISVQEADSLCKHFSSILLQFCNNRRGDLSFVKQIPMYITISNSVISIPTRASIYTITDRRGFTFSHEHPHGNDSIVFLHNDPNYDELYNYIKCESITLSYAYLRLIIPQFKNMSFKTKMLHAEFLKDLFNNRFDWNQLGQENCTKILDFIKQFKFIKTNQTEIYQAPHYFYDSTKAIFQLMIPLDKLLPQEYCNDWRGFLMKLGVIHELSDKDLIAFAYQIADQPDPEKSKALINCLFDSGSPRRDPSVLEKISYIRFVQPYQIEEKFDQIAPQFGKIRDELPNISFRNAIFNGSDNFLFVWTRKNLLPSEGTYSRNQTLLNTLGVQLTANPLSVCQHLLAIVSAITNVPRHYWSVTEVLHKIFHYLQSIHLPTECTDLLTRAHILPVFNEEQVELDFIQPVHAVVAGLSESEEIAPFLCRFPSNLNKVEKLFLTLGAQRITSARSYSRVFLRFYEASAGQTLSESDWKMVNKCTEGFFKHLHKSNCLADVISDGDILYLPAENRCLVDSRRLVYVDNPALKGRITRLQEQIFNSPSFKYDLIDIFNKLPEALRPIALSNIMKEVIIVVEICTSQDDFYLRVCSKLGSERFARSVVRILYSELRITQHRADSIQNKLKNVIVRPTSRLVTVLHEMEEVIEHSEYERNIHSHNLPNGHTIIYLKASSMEAEHPMILTKLSQIVSKMIVETANEKCSWLIRCLFECEDQQMDSLLDDFSVRECPFQFKMNEIECSLSCGDYVPLEWHRLLILEQDYQFTESCLVAHQLFDPEIQDQPVYIVCKVVRMYVNEENKMYNTCLIQFNDHESKKVEVFYLFQFKDELQRPSNSTTKSSISLANLPKADIPKRSTMRKAGFSRNNVRPEDFRLEDIKDEINRDLELARDLTCPNLRQLIKRMALKWHPNRNVHESTETCTAVQHFLFKEIQKFDQLQSFEFTRAVDCRAQFSHFQSSGLADRCHVKHPANPQPAEAKRWLKQAGCDLNASRNHYKRDFSEWVCYQCHQAAEKALKAVRFQKGLPFLKDHNLRLLSWDDEEIRSWCSQLESIGCTASRLYPDLQTGSIPNEIYDSETSSKAYHLASSIIYRAQQMIYF